LVDDYVNINYVCEEINEKYENETKFIGETKRFYKEFRPFSVTINDKFISPMEDPCKW
jgi:hypothetical protein